MQPTIRSCATAAAATLAAAGVLAVTPVMVPSPAGIHIRPLQLTAGDGTLQIFPAVVGWGPEGDPTDVVSTGTGGTVDITQDQAYANYLVTAEDPTTPVLATGQLASGDAVGSFVADEQIDTSSGWGNESATITDATGTLTYLNGDYTHTVITPFGNFSYGDIPANALFHTATVNVTADPGVNPTAAVGVSGWLPDGLPTDVQQTSTPFDSGFAEYVQGSQDQEYANYVVTGTDPSSPVLATGDQAGTFVANESYSYTGSFNNTFLQDWSSEYVTISGATGSLANLNGDFLDTWNTPFGDFTFGDVPANISFDTIGAAGGDTAGDAASSAASGLTDIFPF